MSKNKSDDKAKTDQPPLDYQTEVKMLSFTVSLKEDEIQDLKVRNSELRLSFADLEKEKNELKAAYLQSFKTEKTIRQMKDLLNQSEKDIEKMKEELNQKEKDFHDEKELLTKKFELDLGKLKQTLDSHQKKIENVNALQNRLERQDEQIKQLEQEKEKLKQEAEESIKNKEIRNQIKFSDLKKKMMENIQETQKNVTQLNIEYMDVSTKLTLLQNHQLLIELEYQAQQIEELLRKKENLEKKVFELTKDIEVHKEVEIALASKNKKYTELVKILERTNETLETNNNSESNNKPYANNQVKEFSVINSLEKKVFKLESGMKKKHEEFIKVKNNLEYLEDKLKNYERKYAGIFFLFEEGLKRFTEDEELPLNRDIYVNLENLKKGDFSSLSGQEKYSVIVLLMKYLVPLINPSDLKQSEMGLNGSLENVNIKYHISKKYLEDPLLKKVLTNKKNMIHGIRRSLENLPVINKMGVNVNNINTSKSYY